MTVTAAALIQCVRRTMPGWIRGRSRRVPSPILIAAPLILFLQPVPLAASYGGGAAEFRDGVRQRTFGCLRETSRFPARS